MKIEWLKNNPKICLNADSQVVEKETGNQTDVEYMINNTGSVIRKIDRDTYFDVHSGEVKNMSIRQNLEKK